CRPLSALHSFPTRRSSDLGPGPRLTIEALAASLAFATGARVHLVNDPVDWFITVSWLVVLTNSFNLLDNMDGVAGVVATGTAIRSEEHTSELQSRFDLVCR